MIRNKSQNAPIIIIMAIYLIIAVLFAVFTPDWQTPDEPAHYNYIAQVAKGELPVIEDGDWDSALLGKLTSGQFAPGLPEMERLDTIEYEDHQPPLYYY